MFTTVRQFNSLSDHKLENMDDLINDFKKHIEDFKAQRHDLLDYNNINFDRRFVEFNVNISKQE